MKSSNNISGLKFKDRSIFFDKNGYPKIKINNKSVFVHRLVWVDVNGEIPKEMTINHIDGNKLNYNIENLELLTLKDNIQHAWKNGLCNPSFGENHGRSKLDDIKVLTIRTIPRKAKNGRGSGFSNIELANIYNVSSKVLREAREGITWRHLPLH